MYPSLCRWIHPADDVKKRMAIHPPLTLCLEAGVFSPNLDKFFQVTIPLDRDLGDFEEALEMALQEIELFEKEKRRIENDKRTIKHVQRIV